MIEEKLKILVENHIIDEGIQKEVLGVLGFLNETGPFASDKVDVFLTHLAMAMNRGKSNQDVGEMDILLVEEVRNSPKFLEAKNLWEKMVTQFPNVKLNEMEMPFIYLHLVNLLMG